ncbi:MAG: DUF1015 family protein [Bacteroidota bacterium]
MKILPFQAMYPDLDLIASEESFFNSVKEQYNEYEESGFFKKTAEEAVFIYQIKTNKRYHIGIVSCLDIEDYNKGRILKHEKTLASKEQSMMNLMLQRKANVKPVLLTYTPVKEINNWIKNNAVKANKFYTVRFSELKEVHTYWKIADGNKIQKIKKIFEKKLPYVYIADGHHRCSTSALLHTRKKGKVKLLDFSKLLCVFFSTDELEIHDYNRIIELENDQSYLIIMAELTKYFHINVMRRGAKPKIKHEIVMHMDGKWFSLRWKDSVLHAHKDADVLLDTELLNRYVLKPILGIKDVRSDTRVRYVSGKLGVKGILNKTTKFERSVSFMIYPVEFDELQEVADKKLTLPPKSTWFEPRIKNGMLIQKY